jgi:UrcA family protein
MIRTSRIALPVAALAASLLAAPLPAKARTIEGGAPAIQQSVSYGDLDLREKRARSELARRVMHAAWAVCIEAEGLASATFALGNLDGNCPNSAFHAARPQMRRAIDQAQSGRSAMTTRILVAVRRAR